MSRRNLMSRGMLMSKGMLLSRGLLIAVRIPLTVRKLINIATKYASPGLFGETLNSKEHPAGVFDVFFDA